MSGSLELTEALALAKAGTLPQVILAKGDEYLCRSALSELTGLLVPETSRSLNVVELDAAAGPRRVAEEVQTLPMFRGTKVVLVQPAEFLAPRRGGRGNPFGKPLELWESGKQKEAARRVLSLAGRAGFALQEIASAGRDRWKEAGFEVGRAELDLVAKAAELALSEGLELPESDTRKLEALLSGGLPTGHYLFLAAEEVDPKAPLVRLCLDHGAEMVREIQSTSAGFGKREVRDMGELAQEVLAPLGKEISRDAAKLLAASGEDARGLSNELEKLAAFVGERARIEVADVRELIPESVGDDLFAVSNALEERNAAALVTAVDDELQRGAVPLQILGSLASAVRGLLAARGRLSALGIERRFSYQDFERRAAAAFAEADKRAGKKAGHPFRAFKRAEASMRYSLPELSALLSQLADADAGIKRGMDGSAWLARLAAGLSTERDKSGPGAVYPAVMT